MPSRKRSSESSPDRNPDPGEPPKSQAGVGVGDDQLHAGEAAFDKRAQEAAPEGLRLGLADVERDHLAEA